MVSLAKYLDRQAPYGEPFYDNIPESLRSHDQWILWRGEWREKTQSWAKIPKLAVDPSRNASSTDASTWTDYGTAQAACEESHPDQCSGLGFAFSQLDAFVGIDLDDARDPVTGETLEWALPILERFAGTYIEESPSGTGFKVWVKGIKAWRGSKVKCGSGEVEVYDRGRYFTVTGERYGDAIEVTDQQEALDWLGTFIFGNAPATPEEPPRVESSGGLVEVLNAHDRQTAIDSMWRLGSDHASDYDQWLRVGMACHQADPSDSMRVEWDKWSRTCPEKYDPAACLEKWNSFSRHENGVGVGSLVHMAKADAPPPEPPVAWRPYPVDVLPKPVREYAKAAAVAIGCDVSFIALPLLCCLARAIGNRRVVQLKRSWSEPAILWAAIIQKSGGHKTPSLIMAQSILERYQNRAYAEYKEADAAYQVELAIYQRDLAHWKKSKSDTPPPDEPERPICTRYLTSDATIEALVDRLADQFDGLLVWRDELAGWLGGLAEYKGGKGSDLGHWLASWSGGSITVDRKTGSRQVIHCKRAALSLCGGIQPAILRKAIGHEHRQDGLCARLLLTMPPARPVRWRDESIDHRTEQALVDVFDRLLALEPGIDPEGELEPIAVQMDPAAKQLWIEFYDRHRDEQADLNDDLAAAWSKLEACAARLALIIGMCRGETAISAESIEAAIALVEWHGNEARRVYGLFSESDQEREERELVEFIEQRGGRITARELARSGRLYAEAGIAEQRLQELVNAKRGHWDVVHPEGGGRPSTYFVISETPTPSTLTKPSKPQELRGFVDTDPENDSTEPDFDGDFAGEMVL